MPPKRKATTQVDKTTLKVPHINNPYSCLEENLESLNEPLNPKSLKLAAYLESYKSRSSSSNNDVWAQFAQSQLVRQAASLSSNRSKQDTSENEEIVIKNHLSALKMALDYGGPLTCETLCAWHRTLCAGLIPTNGVLRSTGVRCGSRSFCPPAQVRTLMTQFLVKVQDTIGRYDLLPQRKAAAVAVWFLSIHPFTDGNGRMGRILCNWMLKRCGYPFSLALCSTPQQRTHYIAAIKNCQDAGDTVAFSAFLVEVALHAWEEVNSLTKLAEANRMQTKLNDAMRDAIRGERAAARLRGCMICLEDAPNVATLCCGAAVHINCLGDWLSSTQNPMCIQCREPLPHAPPRPPAPAPAAAAPAAADDDDTTNDSDTASDHGTETETDAIVPPPVAPGPVDDDTTSDVHDVDDDTEEDDDTEVAPPETEEDDAEDNTARAQRVVDSRRRCEVCNNVAAAGCINNRCGRCCLTHSGGAFCQRHGC